MPTFVSFDLGSIALVVFYVIAALYVIFSVIFYYHWVSYAVNARVMNLTLVLYFATTLPLAALMGITLLFL